MARRIQGDITVDHSGRVIGRSDSYTVTPKYPEQGAKKTGGDDKGNNGQDRNEAELLDKKPA